LWQNLPNLKRLNLSRSLKLTRIPDLSLSPNIEEIILSYCEKLIQVHSSIFLNKLSCLCLDNCYHLNSVNIPSKILSTSPGLILLSNFWELKMFSTSQRPTFSRSPHQKLGHQCGNFSRFPRQKPEIVFKLQSASAVHSFPTSSEIFSITFDRYNEEEVANNTVYLQFEV